MSIILLDEATIAKIAAGEIIENPASIVKELLENSIDAKAKNIIVEVRGNIGSYIRITDDGIGMDKDDLNLAFLRHSTSKLKTAEDLHNIVSLGFRGEALASISHISKIEVLTKTKDDLSGTRAEIEDGKIVKMNSIGLPVGTTFYVKDVFYNMPVRKKYLKLDNTEFNYIYEVVQKIALGNPDISIKLIRDNKVILNSSATDNLKNHIFSILGREVASNLIEGNFSSNSYKIKSFISDNKLYRSNRYHQYIYINGRYVKNLDISKEIEKHYYSLIPLNRYPVFLLYIDIDPILVDVNVHPKKHEVKLSKENNILAILSDLVDETLYPNRSIINPIKEEPKERNINIFEMFKEVDSEQNTQNKTENFIYNNSIEEFESKTNAFFEEQKHIYNNTNNTCENNEDFKNINSSLENSNTNNNEDSSKIDCDLLNTRLVGILFKTFIILENYSKGRCYLIDQHAAHERILYEKFKEQFENSEVLSQILITPEIIELSVEEKEKLENNYELFKSLGFEIEEFGENSIVIRQVPMIFGHGVRYDFIHDTIDSLDKIKQSSYEVDSYKIMKKACKAAVKAGDELSDMEVQALIKSLLECKNPYTCPHGRPTIIELKSLEIEKLFLRE
ncbi:DNA mismatch repair endonuclease MutL [Peptoniphilus sp. oral taxon 386]|uniref:DNA mismatch repair endonuclease MutL n=1 Tax=Peptoniphilus sp. oral taxon 386 TaxID=652713 RepID=UPI0001DA9D48|nr:DNA mismatch repair endonuclease MutL [Peptoniphilus sp. oral taxon 386]EFI42300.1 DNA mismatch repair domain protein [Peptoniphilus sp. oral taxon 386 str. F0131]